jgi:hypothetical protein
VCHALFTIMGIFKMAYEAASIGLRATTLAMQGVKG